MLQGEAYEAKFNIKGGKNKQWLNKAIESWQKALKLEPSMRSVIEDKINRVKKILDENGQKKSGRNI